MAYIFETQCTNGNVKISGPVLLKHTLHEAIIKLSATALCLTNTHRRLNSTRTDKNSPWNHTVIKRHILRYSTVFTIVNQCQHRLYTNEYSRAICIG